MPAGNRLITSAVLACGALTLSACASISHVQLAEGEAPVVQGPPARDNATPLAAAYSCMAERLYGIRPVGIGVGDVKDYTGKFSDKDGQAITQGGALMVISALGKLGPTVRVHERFDTKVAEMELVYLDRRQLGDGRRHSVDGKHVPWEPYYGGTIRGSDYYIVGGITELNYNIQSGGAELQVNQIGPKARTYVMNIAADLRIVDTRSLVVMETVSLQKQIVGYEVGVDVFRFFNSDLVDIHTGAKNQEPLQLGVRTVLEMGVLELISAVTDVPYEPCLDPAAAVPLVAGEESVRKTADAGDADAADARMAASQAEPDAPPPATGPSGATHVVVAGETIYAIGRRYGVSSDAILAANDMAAPEALRAGQELIVPGADNVSSAAPQHTTVAAAASPPAADAAEEASGTGGEGGVEARPAVPPLTTIGSLY